MDIKRYDSESVLEEQKRESMDIIPWVKHSDHIQVVKELEEKMKKLEKLNSDMWGIYFTDHCPSEHGFYDIGCTNDSNIHGCKECWSYNIGIVQPKEQD